MESSLEMYSIQFNLKIHQFVKIVSNLGLQYQYQFTYFKAKLPLVCTFTKLNGCNFTESIIETSDHKGNRVTQHIVVTG